MSEVYEQGATRRLRPSDFGGSLNFNSGADRRRPVDIPEPKYPKNPASAPGKRVPGITPKWSPGIERNPFSPREIGQYLSDVGPEAARDMVKLGGMFVGGRIGVALRALSWVLTLADLIDWDWFKGKPGLKPGWNYSLDCKPWDGLAWRTGQRYSSCPAPGGLRIGKEDTNYHYNSSPEFNVTRYVTLYNKLIEYPTQYQAECAQVLHADTGVTVDPFTDPPYISPDPMLNPNLARAMPSLPAFDFDSDPVAEPDAKTDTSGKHTDGQGIEYSSDGAVRRETVDREPPAKRERQRKAMSNSAKLGVALFKALDEISESAEVVDAIYQALPKPVRKKWGCDKIKRGLVDSAGQYGIDAADCKAKAIYHNAQNIDVMAAVENIFVNYLQDKLIGSVYRTLPKDVGNAVGPGVQAVNKGFEGLVDAVLSV
jgi:hypothetical protein